MKIENNLRVSSLIDVYGSLLTSRQYDMITSYYFDNLSLSEIGYNFNVSRQAVSDSINQSIKALEGFENKLHYVSRVELLTNELNKLASDYPVLRERINKIIDDLRS
ncbi:MAG: YlxM family DNA-binding protein [Christensenellales bacterium]